MAATKFLHTMRDFSKGIHDKDAPNLIPDNSLVEAQNAVIGKGYVEKRNGYQASRWTPTGQRETTWADIGEKNWGDL